MDLIGSADVAKKNGRIAQLGERCPYKAEVTGSIPVPPTISGCLGKLKQEDCAPCREFVCNLGGGSTTDDCALSCLFLMFCHKSISRGRRSAWLGRQIVNLEVAGSNPVGPAIFPQCLVQSHFYFREA
jgi:hypothetical protein